MAAPKTANKAGVSTAPRRLSNADRCAPGEGIRRADALGTSRCAQGPKGKPVVGNGLKGEGRTREEGALTVGQRAVRNKTSTVSGAVSAWGKETFAG